MNRKTGLLAAIAVLLCAGYVQGRPPTSPDDPRSFAKQQRDVRQGEAIVRRLLRNPRTSAEIRQQATELQAALEARARIIARLQGAHKQFLSDHQADLHEIEKMRQRAFEIDQRLDASRKALLEANASDIAELVRNSDRALELIQQLRAAQMRERRGPRGQ